jgi:hypothetical protein
LQGELGKAFKEMRNKNATGDKDVPEYVLGLLVEDGIRLMTTDQKHT